MPNDVIKNKPLEPTFSFDDLAPNFMIKINGKELSQDMLALISNVEVELEIGMVDSIKFDIANLNLKTQFYPKGSTPPPVDRISDLTMFAEGNVVEVMAGYADNLAFLCRGKIQNWLPDFPKDGAAVLKVQALGAAQEMLNPVPPKRDKNQWRNKNYQDVIKSIGSQYGFDTSMVAAPRTVAPKKGITLKPDVSDWDFIKELASLNAYEFYVTYDPDKKKDVLFWGPPQPNKKPSYVLYYDNGDKTTLFSLEPEFSLTGQAAQFNVYGWDAKNNRVIVFRIMTTQAGEKYKWEGGSGAGNAITKQIVHGDSVALGQFGTNIYVTASSTVNSEPEARAMANRILALKRDAFLIAKGSTIGVETIKPMQVHELKGIGNRFSGKYYFRAVRHIIAKEAYTTAFTATLVPTTIPKEGAKSKALSVKPKRKRKKKKKNPWD